MLLTLIVCRWRRRAEGRPQGARSGRRKFTWSKRQSCSLSLLFQRFQSTLLAHPGIQRNDRGSISTLLRLAHRKSVKLASDSFFSASVVLFWSPRSRGKYPSLCSPANEIWANRVPPVGEFFVEQLFWDSGSRNCEITLGLGREVQLPALFKRTVFPNSVQPGGLEMTSNRKDCTCVLDRDNIVSAFRVCDQLTPIASVAIFSRSAKQIWQHPSSGKECPQRPRPPRRSGMTLG